MLENMKKTPSDSSARKSDQEPTLRYTKVKPIDISVILGYILAAVFFAFGVVVVSGIAIPDYVPKEFRLTIGVVLLLWGIYRFVLTRTKSNDAEGSDK
jgi:hypothetical protein